MKRLTHTIATTLLPAGALALPLFLSACFWGEIAGDEPVTEEAVWNLLQDVDVEVEVGAALRTADVLRVEVRHGDARHGRLIYTGLVDAETGFRLDLPTRLGRHETSVRVALTDGDWVRFETVPVGGDGRAVVQFE